MATDGRMITQFRLENFKAHRDTILALGPFTVLVGDNASGKTSVLEALRLPGELTAGMNDVAFVPLTDELCELFRYGERRMRVSAQGQTAEGQPWALVGELVQSREGLGRPSMARSRTSRFAAETSWADRECSTT